MLRKNFAPRRARPNSRCADEHALRERHKQVPINARTFLDPEGPVTHQRLWKNAVKRMRRANRASNRECFLSCAPALPAIPGNGSRPSAR